MSEQLYGKRKLCSTEVTEFTDFQGIGKDPLYKRFDSVYSVVEKYVKPQYRDFLAQPMYSDEDRINWFVRKWNEIPCQYKDLSETEKSRYTDIKEKTIDEYNEVCRNLKGEDKQILISALKYIDENFMFCYDGKVVVVAWGMSPISDKHIVKGAVIHDLEIQSRHKVRFDAGGNGVLLDKLMSVVIRSDGAVLSSVDLPKVIANKGYEFKAWEPEPLGMVVRGPLTFTAIYEELPFEGDADSKDKENEREMVRVTFIAKEGGEFRGETEYLLDKGACLDMSQIPEVIPDSCFSFAGWDKQTDMQIDEDVTFYALFKRDDVTCWFVAGEHGFVEGEDSFTLPCGSVLKKEDIPDVREKNGYSFVGWDKSPVDFVLNEDTTFTAQYEKDIPWYKQLWNWLTGKGCLKWLLWLLLFVLIVLLLSWLLKCCGDDSIVEEVSTKETSSGEVIDDNGLVRGIVGDDGKLPDNSVVAPIVGDDGERPPIVSRPGEPDVVANRLNIYFEDASVNLEQFVADLFQVYSESQCQVIGMDRNVPMIQILVPENLRDEIRRGLNGQLSGYDFFVVDESIFSIVGSKSVSVAKPGWHLRAIDVENGWSITKGNPNVIVAVVDDGIDARHDIFERRIVKPYNVFTQNNKLSAGQGHGTHVAGLAVGSDKMFSEGISGIAPNCKLMPVQVFDNGICTFSSVVSGIMYAIHNGACVVNVSIGPNFKGLDVLPLPDQNYIAKTKFKNEERVWKRVIDVANEHNVIIVFAVGNDNILASVPPENRTDRTINVAAVNQHLKGTDFTNYGKGSNVSAPGVGIVSAVPFNEYAAFDGTSMAAPIVSGTVALMRSCKTDISVTEILSVLRSTGKLVDGNMPPMIQVDDALMALKTGLLPKETFEGVQEGGVDGDSAREGSSESGDESSSSDSNSEDDKKQSQHEDVDYDSIRKLIEEYKRKIEELEKLLPEKIIN
jgi:subtilisin family serine protease